MSEGSALNSQSDVDQLEAAVDQAIAACRGDTRAAMRALIMANGYLRSENERLTKAVSFAFMRAPLSPDRKDWCD
jgi:hypothetical protein